MEAEGLLPCSEGSALAPIQSQMNPVHIFPSKFPKIHYNIIFQFTPKSSNGSLPCMFSKQSIICNSHLFHACYMPRPTDVTLFII